MSLRYFFVKQSKIVFYKIEGFVSIYFKTLSQKLAAFIKIINVEEPWYND